MNDAPETLEELHFSIPLGPPPVDAIDILARASFKNGLPPTEKDEPLTASDKAWMLEKAKNPNTPIPAPSFAAQRALQKHLSLYDFIVPGTQDQWQSYVMYKYFELTLDPDPKISKPALDALAKTSVVGLMVEKQEISIVHKSTEELEGALKDAIDRYIGKPIN